MTPTNDIENEEAPLVPLLSGADEESTLDPPTAGRPNPFEAALLEDSE